jgi:hypothetical protein
MTVRFMTGMPDPSQASPDWGEVNGIEYCLNCRREMAGEAKAAALNGDGTPANRVRADAEGRVEFELSRDPDRCDTRIARACGTNVITVRQVRQRLGVYPTRPV